MISLTVTVDNITTVTEVFDRIELRQYLYFGAPPVGEITDLIALSDYTTISGIDTLSNRYNVSDILLRPSTTQYYFTHTSGTSDSWYISRYYDFETEFN